MKKRTGKIYDNDWPIVAICYDFDKTLSPQDMQNFALIPKLKCDVASFWQESNAYAEKHGMDKILAYMRLIIEKAGDNIRIFLLRINILLKLQLIKFLFKYITGLDWFSGFKKPIFPTIS